MQSLPSGERISRRLRVVRLVAFVDLVLLCALLSAALTRQQGMVHILGPLHGINFLLLIVIATTAAIDGLWGWWFPLAILLSAGPPGAFLGEWIIQRQMRGLQMHTSEHTSSETLTLVTDKTTMPVIAPTQQEQMAEHEEQL